MHWLVAYALGVGTIAVAKAAGPALGRNARPLVRKAIKGGMVASQEIQRIAEETNAALGDVTAEAREELEAGREAPTTPPPPAPKGKSAR